MIYKVAIVGSGPAGLSAAAHAAKLGLSHILLEARPHLSDTIYKYQKGKHVMAEPGFLDLRSPMQFQAGTRESILESFASDVTTFDVNVQFCAVVCAIQGERGNFQLELDSTECIVAEHVILAIGVQGNLRTLDVPGESLENVQYQLDDPAAYRGETIMVVGAGDAAIENALALAENSNSVILLNRNEEFSRCKEGNLTAIQTAIDAGQLACRYLTRIDRIDSHNTTDEDSDMNRTMMMSVVDLSRRHGPKVQKPGLLVKLNTSAGEEVIACHRVIGRLGAVAPRKLVEGFGVQFTGKEATALPALSPTYESNVPGLYVVGALGGYPLIKQAMNQGYEAVEALCGRVVVPADQPLLEHKFAALMGAHRHLTSVDNVLLEVARKVPWLTSLSPLQLREFLLESDIRMPVEGSVIFARNDYTNSFFSIVDGSVQILSDNSSDSVIALETGKFFGELGLISGRRRSATVQAGSQCVLVETPRRAMLKMLASSESVRRELDLVALRRAVRKYVAASLSEEQLTQLLEGAQIRHYKAGEALFVEGDASDGLYLIRKGSVMVSRTIGGRDVVLSYVSAGNYVGEMALMMDAPRSATVKAAVPAEAIVLLAKQVTELLAQNTGLRQQLDKQYLSRLQANQVMKADEKSGNLISFLLQQGVGEATDVLLIDESLCIRCDNCEKACADTHGGASRLDREAGPTYANLHVPTSCRHCEHPHCMKDCPPDAIKRSAGGEVYISDTCIGCGNCEKNCPYGVIQMVPAAEKKGFNSLWAWLLFGVGQEPGARPDSTNANLKSESTGIKKAAKCDMCRDLKSGPACVRACPTGAALRISPEKFLDYVGTKN